MSLFQGRARISFQNEKKRKKNQPNKKTPTGYFKLWGSALLRCSVISMTLAKGNICNTFICQFTMPDAAPAESFFFFLSVIRRCWKMPSCKVDGSWKVQGLVRSCEGCLHGDCNCIMCKGGPSVRSVSAFLVFWGEKKGCVLRTQGTTIAGLQGRRSG